jgi:hypothetical protein
LIIGIGARVTYILTHTLEDLLGLFLDYLSHLLALSLSKVAWPTIDTL